MFQESKGVNITVYLIQLAFLQVVQAKKGDCSTERVIAAVDYATTAMIF